jgi:glycosyl-4,4'-diaponeurosporenoate acyltransferase
VRIVHLSDPLTVVVDVVAWGAVHASTGYAVHRLPVRALAQDAWWSRLRRFERDGSVYVRVLRVKRWKDRVPEAGGWFPGGVSKARLPDHRRATLERFVVETRRAELGHWLAALAGPVFVLWNPPAVAVVMVCYALAVNAPFIVIQRYNRARAERVLRRYGARAGTRRATSVG